MKKANVVFKNKFNQSSSIDSLKKYDYLVLDQTVHYGLEKGDTVVVETKNSPAMAIFNEYSDEPVDIDVDGWLKFIVQKVDMDVFNTIKNAEINHRINQETDDE